MEARMEMEDVKTVHLHQVHGDRVVHVRHEDKSFGSDGLLEELEGDALITNRPFHFIMVKTADCLPALLLDPEQKVIAAIHAGWRGTLLNIVKKTIQAMVASYGTKPEDLIAALGPAIGPCCFEIKEDVWNALGESAAYREDVVREKGKGQWLLNLPKLNRLQLLDTGVSAGKIAASGLCTHCLPEQFYSFRREGKRNGHMVSGLMLI